MNYMEQLQQIKLELSAIILKLHLSSPSDLVTEEYKRRLKIEFNKDYEPKLIKEALGEIEFDMVNNLEEKDTHVLSSKDDFYEGY